LILSKARGISQRLISRPILEKTLHKQYIKQGGFNHKTLTLAIPEFSYPSKTRKKHRIRHHFVLQERDSPTMNL